MDITEYVLNAKAQYFMLTGRNATYLYAGDKEFKALKLNGMMRMNDQHYDRMQEPISQGFAFGLKVIEVNLPWHINIA